MTVRDDRPPAIRTQGLRKSYGPHEALAGLDLTVPAGRIFGFLEEHADEKLLIVTHGNILKMMAAYIILGGDCTAKELYLASQRLRTTNTGITTFFKEEAGEWRILIWNDHAHFAE